MKEIELTQGKVALVDDEDYERVNQFNWYASNESCGRKWYAIRREWRDGKRLKIRMHRFIMRLPTGFEDSRVVDHLNNNSLDNRKCNLEIITQSENMLRVDTWKRKIDEPCL